MDVVYRATDLELMREITVKAVSETASFDARQRLIREARALIHGMRFEISV
jgi:hypothetical protein